MWNWHQLRHWTMISPRWKCHFRKDIHCTGRKIKASGGFLLKCTELTWGALQQGLSHILSYLWQLVSMLSFKGRDRSQLWRVNTVSTVVESTGDYFFPLESHSHRLVYRFRKLVAVDIHHSGNACVLLLTLTDYLENRRRTILLHCPFDLR